MIRLLVGLGNPGAEYEGTRHNAGFWWVDAVARVCNAPFRSESRFHGEVARAGMDMWLLKPQTYMNASGRAVGAFATFHRIPADEILVAHDELDLPPGAVKLKFGGGLSGNGLKDVAAALGTRDKAEHATPLGWAEYAATGPESSTRGKQFREIAEYLRAKEQSQR